MLRRFVPDDERREGCLADRQRLRERGAENHLASFLGEVEQQVLPLFPGAAR